MRHASFPGWDTYLLVAACVWLASVAGFGQSARAQPAASRPPSPQPSPFPVSGCQPLPINLATALQLAGARPIDIQIASARVQVAVAQLARARVLWLPNLLYGVDYYRHDGRIQSSQGDVTDTSKSSLMAGVGPNAIFAVSEAVFGPLAARQVVRARQAAVQTAYNDSLLSTAEAYFNLQRARGDLLGSQDTVRRAEELVRRTEQLTPALAPRLEVNRARTELARRRQAAQTAWEQWRTASADLTRVLRLEPATLVQPLEPPHLVVNLTGMTQPVDDLIAVALTNRPELAEQQALVQATLQQLRQERLRPLVPSILLRGAATNPAGTLAAGVFGGGTGSFVGNFGARNDLDIMALWELQNLGFGNRARVAEQRAQVRQSTLELFRVQDRVAAEVVQAHAQVQSAAARVGEAEQELRDATESADKNFAGIGETQRLGGNLVVLLIRPQEVVAAVQALATAYADYFGAVADLNRAQFRLYRALGYPAQWLSGEPAGVCPPAGH